MPGTWPAKVEVSDCGLHLMVCIRPCHLHTDMVVYLQVIKDLCLLRKLLCKSLKPFRSEQAGCLQRLRACGSVATWCALRALAEFMAFMLLCCCGCCMWVHNRKALQDAILPMVQSDTESSAQRLTSIDDDEQPRIGVFIDDLDRCKPTKIIEVVTRAWESSLHHQHLVVTVCAVCQTFTAFCSVPTCALLCDHHT